MSTTSDDLIERIARLIYDADALRPRLAWERLTPLTQGEYRREARAALSAFPLAETDAFIMKRQAEKIDELERENARMRAALEPFCDIIETADGMVCDSCGITVADIRRAREALAGSGK